MSGNRKDYYNLKGVLLMAQFNYGVSIPQAVGGYLKRELKRRGTTQEAFSFDFGVDVRTVRRWISGGVHSLDAVVEIARYFGVSVGDVLSDEDGRPFLCKKIKRSRPDILCPLGISFYVVILCC